MTNRTALYLRSSKDRNDVSIDAQRRALHELAGARALVVSEEFSDAVESGKDEDRPAFQRLIAALKSPERNWEHILVLDTSRIARRRLISMLFEQDCSKRGVKLIYRSVPESDPATDMVLRSMLQAFDEYHSMISRAKGLAGMAENVRQGWRAGGKAPRGYQLDYTATGAVRDGAPVLKSRLVVDEETSPAVQEYLLLRACGVARGAAIARLKLPWPSSSTNGMDWQALTYAGHTVWNMHAERQGSTSITGEKRRPRDQWVINRGTHPALISDDEAEAILSQCERSTQNRRLRASPLLLTGLLVSSEGEAWHSDGCGYYRLGKGRKIAAHRVESAVLERLSNDWLDEATVTKLRASIEELAAGGEPVDGRRLAGMEKRAGSLAVQIGKTVDLAAQLDDPAPVLRRVQDLEHQRAQLLAELADMRSRKDQSAKAATITSDQVRALLRRLFGDIAELSEGTDQRPKARLAMAAVLERVELDVTEETPRLQLRYAVATGVTVASPRGFEPL